ncbi:hypothetical protein ABZY02_02735 [Streptomyces sp. NPDC006649]|uniref:hypothetical protein n=1 Tax=unclassified Streptomyces TaxID=2593676 RepID=UPI003246295A
MSRLDTDEDYDHWIDLPVYDGWQDFWGSEKKWAKFTAENFLQINDLPSGRGEIKRLAKILIENRRACEASSLGNEHFLYFADPEQPPIALHIPYGPSEGEREATLRQLAHADSTEVITSPQVEVFETRAFGAGLRSRNHVMLDDQSIVVNLWYGFRDEAHGMDLIVFVSTGDLGRLAAAEPHIDEFVRSIKFVDEDEEV